jgi:hypothetical protein
MKKLLATLLITSTLVTPCLALTTTECQQIQQTAHQMAECARQLGYPEDSVIIQEAQKKWREAESEKQKVFVWDGPILTKSKGVNYGPLGRETYYNLPMQGVINIMRRSGYDAGRFPYCVREDGVRMLGDYIMLAGRVGQFERGTIVRCSLGEGMICDYGYLEWNGVDVAVVW